VFVVDSNLIVLAEGVRVRDRVPEPDKSISERFVIPSKAGDCVLSSGRAEVGRLAFEYLIGITAFLSRRRRRYYLMESCALVRYANRKGEMIAHHGDFWKM
jgi:hypothetical protein